jgi:hypothetical protein
VLIAIAALLVTASYLLQDPERTLLFSFNVQTRQKPAFRAGFCLVVSTYFC